MALNYSKIIYAGKTLIDLTADTVVADKLLVGYTAHGADGALIEGACSFDADTQDATAADSEILAGKTAYVKGVKKTGTMTNNGGAQLAITEKAQQVNIPQGYHDGSGYAEIAAVEQQKLIAENIREGVTILGVQGSMTGTEDAVAETKEVTPSTSEQVILPNTDEGYNYIAQVTVKPIPYVETENNAGGLTVTIG
jgi:hypothetical protein